MNGLRMLGRAAVITALSVPGLAAADTVLNLGDTVTATGAGASQVLNVSNTGLSNPLISPTISFSFGDAFNGSGQLATGSDFNLAGGSWNFQDDYTFSTTGSTVTTAGIAVPGQPGASLTGLQARIIMANGNPAPTIGAPVGGTIVDQWVTLTAGNTSYFSLGAGQLTPGTTYVLQIRGEATGAAGYGGSIAFTPVPLPAALPLLLSGLGLVGRFARRRVTA